MSGSAIVQRIGEEARARGLLLMAAGVKRNIIRVLVPLVIDKEDLESALDRLDEAVSAVLT